MITVVAFVESWTESRLNTPATVGEHDDGPSAAFKRRLHSPDGGDLGGVGGEGSEATQLLKQLLVENGRFRLPADLHGCVGDTDRGKGSPRATKTSHTHRISPSLLLTHTHTHTDRVHHCNCLHRKRSLRCLCRQHHTVSSVQHGVGNVTALRSGWPGVGHHTLQHLNKHTHIVHYLHAGLLTASQKSRVCTTAWDQRFHQK